MKKVILNPLFIIGLVIRLGLVFLIQPQPVIEWYVPFLNISTTAFSLDPWELWLTHGGDPIAFPYGYVMWLTFLPLTLLCKLLSLPLIYGYGFTLIIIDFSLLQVLRKIIPNRDRLLLVTYWLSPIVIVASYFMGFNDLVPVLLLSLALYYVKKSDLLFCGMACIAAISAKLSMILALPFFLIYLIHNRGLRQLLPDYIKGMSIGIVITLLPFLFSYSGLSMIASNPEMIKVYKLAFDLGSGMFIYLVPLAYCITLYITWRVKRLNFELFNALMGLVFLLVVLMTPASPGWFIWTIPLLVSYQAISDRVSILLVSLFSVLYVLSSLLLSPTDFIFYYFNGLNIPETLYSSNDKLSSLIYTGMVATGIILAVRIYRENVIRNDYFRLSRKPFVIGIAGDSGAGKDTFSDSIMGLFGQHSVTTLSGDDYHLWDRQKPMWQVMTHLNPMANDLEGFANDLVSLTDGKSIQARHYDHSSGRMSKPFTIKSNDIIIASGLHALYLHILRKCYNLSVYLDIDEDLRRHFKLQRDVHQRGHTVERVLTSFEKREPDSERFIRPQAAHADLVLSLQPIRADILDDKNLNRPLRFKLVVRSRHGLNELSLTRVLVGVCGLHVDIISSNDASEVELTIEGETSAQDIELAAQMICPRIFEFLDIKPQWRDGVVGLMQLITLSHINQALTKRFIW
ncbi:uridine kinase [Yersinia massiliensis]|uniref:uridine kinase n=1 Tax=Yersinia massiliensis TaxID=419257 RepID=UPI0005DCAB3F|nr:uridine kinase [Yersinia massiliensis]CNI30330.1 uridine kinase [Yersinia massiliensis]